MNKNINLSKNSFFHTFTNKVFYGLFFSRHRLLKVFVSDAFPGKTLTDSLFQFTLGRCWPTSSPVCPGSVWTRRMAWTSACPSSGFCSSRRARSSAGTGRCTERSGENHAAAPLHNTPPAVPHVLLFCLQERQLF